MNSEASRGGMAMPVNDDHSGKRSRPQMENGDFTFLARPMYKRRKVSAVRDFPEKCGPSTSMIDPVLKINIGGCHSADGTIIENKNGEQFGGNTVVISKCENDPQHSEFRKGSFSTKNLGQTTDCCLNKENFVGPSHLVDGLTANIEPAKVPLTDMETLDTELARTVDSVKCNSSDLFKSSSPMDDVAVLDSSKSLSFNVYLPGSSTCTEEVVCRRDFPQRTVSAVRDFPPLCGRNAPRLSKDMCLEQISSLNNDKVGQQDLAVGDNPLKRVADVKDVKNNGQDEYGCKGKLMDIIQADLERNATERVKKLDVFEPTSELKLHMEKTSEKYITLPEKGNNHHQVKINSKSEVKKQNKDGVLADRTSGQEIIVHPDVQSPKTKHLNMSSSLHKLKGSNRLQVSSDRKVVLGLMARSECPWRSDKVFRKFKSIDGTKEKKGKKVDSLACLGRSKTAIKTKGALNLSGKKSLKKIKGDVASEGMNQLVIWEKNDFLDASENIEDLEVVSKSHSFNVIVPPPGHSNFSGNGNDSNVTRNKVRETLRLFQAVSRKLLQEVESRLKGRSNSKRVDLQAAKILKDKGKYVNSGKQILGSVPGVEVGDEFQYRVELNIIGLHRLTQGGIDYVKHNDKILATSIVASGGYADDLDNSDVLIYTGQGGNVMNTDKEPEDQKLERGNLALNNSIEEKNPVRVIRGYESMEGKCKTYVYDGLYVVESRRQDIGPHGKLVFRFFLRRIPGQPELALKEVKKSKKFKTREGLCVDDISYGKERIPICAVNTIDDEKPPPFNYITSIIYPDCHLVPAEGCDCTNGCSDLEKCSCVVKNGGEIPFNHNEAIVEAKTLVYECGPSCKCPPTCHNRVSQRGIKFQLEIFKTQERGWGVRSLNSIPSGSFICEYIGELLEEKEAEQRTGNDEYLFDIGNNYSNSTLWGGLSTLMPDAQTSSCEVVKDGGFTIDAAQFGNVGRFINHSCSPNLYAQNALYDHHDTRMPHIMFFAVENIPPLQELTYDYNYAIDQVRDSEGNVKKKYCHCGSVECSGRMY